jgi:NAD(P)H-hydrate repair Nnr-like enzyme with NAD(P)H-hydrate dehydratase domain
MTARGGCPPVPAITADLLRGMKLPAPDDDGDKDERGRVLVVAGAVELPGAPLRGSRRSSC